MTQRLVRFKFLQRQCTAIVQVAPTRPSYAPSPCVIYLTHGSVCHVSVPVCARRHLPWLRAPVWRLGGQQRHAAVLLRGQLGSGVRHGLRRRRGNRGLQVRRTAMSPVPCDATRHSSSCLPTASLFHYASGYPSIPSRSLLGTSDCTAQLCRTWLQQLLPPSPQSYLARRQLSSNFTRGIAIPSPSVPLWADNGLYYAFRPHGPEVPTWMDRVACPGGARRLSDCTSAIPACSRNQQVGECRASRWMWVCGDAGGAAYGAVCRARSWPRIHRELDRNQALDTVNGVCGP